MPAKRPALWAAGAAALFVATAPALAPSAAGAVEPTREISPPRTRLASNARGFELALGQRAVFALSSDGRIELVRISRGDTAETGLAAGQVSMTLRPASQISPGRGVTLVVHSALAAPLRYHAAFPIDQAGALEHHAGLPIEGYDHAPMVTFMDACPARPGGWNNDIHGPETDRVFISLPTLTTADDRTCRA